MTVQTVGDSGTETAAVEIGRYLKFQCSVCKKIFACKTSLQMHLNIHTGTKPFICKDANCGAKFSHSSNLRRHMKTVHRNLGAVSQ